VSAKRTYVPVVAVSRTRVLILAIMLPSPALADVAIQFASSDSAEVAVVGISEETLGKLADATLDRAAWQRVLALYVDANGRRPALPVLGDYRVQDDRLLFTPQFPFRPGLAYRAAFDANALPSANRRAREPVVETTLRIPDPQRGPPTIVEAIYPSSDALPENLLKFYIHFSAPMSRGGSYRHIRLLDATGSVVDLPFLELAEELWDQSGRRLTLLLDPGRVKRELKPNDEVGRALVDGGAYSLAIAKDWPDATGAPLGGDYRKRFRVTKADVHQPDPNRWRLTIPKGNSREQLEVEFDEPLDHALLQHSIEVVGPAGDAVNGRTEVSKHETRLRFVPQAAWAAGDYRVVVDARLEDRAGNSIERPFEVHLPSGRPAEIEEFVIPFKIERRPGETKSSPRSGSR
jgi:hypothetical protein